MKNIPQNICPYLSQKTNNENFQDKDIGILALLTE